MSIATRSLFERILSLHRVTYRRAGGRLLVLECGTDAETREPYARWVACPRTERHLYRWLGY